ncbi:hypothetical protein [Streptomyces sp. NPDC102437]|uniref:hypothetical protein n=1 Tax=Streptomyces sp. NPDC102437 TaxID=3366175 RepID=UPI003829E3A9
MSSWMMRARVRVVADVAASNPYTRPRVYRAGDELEMLLRGIPGEPMNSAQWWSSADVNGAYILPFEAVAVLEPLGPTWVKCGWCEAGGRIERDDDGLAYVDVGSRIAQRRRAAKIATRGDRA